MHFYLLGLSGVARPICEMLRSRLWWTPKSSGFIPSLVGGARGSSGPRVSFLTLAVVGGAAGPRVSFPSSVCCWWGPQVLGCRSSLPFVVSGVRGSSGFIPDFGCRWWGPRVLGFYSRLWLSLAGSSGFIPDFGRRWRGPRVLGFHSRLRPSLVGPAGLFPFSFLSFGCPLFIFVFFSLFLFPFIPHVVIISSNSFFFFFIISPLPFVFITDAATSFIQEIGHCET